ncbi:MAG: glycosyltransferase family 2 protein [Candidatus Marinimicrobia bacterium]|nr:glycosyltransferase family 2 protein [Candidatus Neomarinimicrobiota bacterium]
MKVSIVTSTFNSEKTILDTLNSVKNQTYKNIEHIIVDGLSTDKTLQIINNFENENLKIISEPDNGIYDAMNKGLKIATGEVIGLLNSDDLFFSNESISYIVSAFSDDIDACYSDLVYVNEENNKILRYWKSNDYILGSFGIGWSPPHPTFYIKSSVLGKKKFDLSYPISADVELMSRLMEVHKIKTRYIPKTLVRMRVGGASNRNLKSIFDQNIEVIKSFKKNKIKFNIVLFFVKKIINRFVQYISASHSNK